MCQLPESPTYIAISAVRVGDPKGLRLVLGGSDDVAVVEDFLAHKPPEWTNWKTHYEFATFAEAIRVVESKAVLCATAWRA